MRRVKVVAATVVWTAGLAGAPARAETATALAVADAHVSGAAPSTNYGAATSLVVDDSPLVRTFVRFDARGEGSVVRATLRVWARKASSVGFHVRGVASTTWKESTITFTTAPARSPVVTAGSGPVGAGAWASVDVTPLVGGTGLVSMALATPGATSIAFASREAGASTAPRLLIERAPGADPVVGAAGDIACDPRDLSFNAGAGTATQCRAQATADLLRAAGVTAVLPLGDQQYEWATLDDFRRSYALSWGAFDAVVHPVAGNHEYFTYGAAGYFDYFGAAAGSRWRGYYSYDLGAWHVVALNSNCGAVGGCGDGSPQEQWLRADLAAHPAACTLATWHHPRFSSARIPDDLATDALWRALVAARADVVLSAHHHHYERFAPLGASGAVDASVGARQFVVGTGGRSLSALEGARAGSEVRATGAYGILTLTMRAASYEWRFRPAPASSFTDAGSGPCR